ncbi:MAG: PAS domain S-box protein, partial [bacterium]
MDQVRTEDWTASSVPRLAEHHLANLLHCAPLAAVIWHRGRIVEANQLFLDMVGCDSASAALGLPIAQFFPDQEPACGLGTADGWPSPADAREREITATRSDGTSFPLRLSLSRLNLEGSHDLEGSPAFLALCADLSESRRAEESLRRTQFSVDHAADLVYWADAKGHLVGTSASTAKRLGFSHDELLEMTLFDITVGLTPEAWPKLWKAAKSGPYTAERELKTKAGETFPVAISVNYLAEKDREYHCVFAHDISKRLAQDAKIRHLSSF